MPDNVILTSKIVNSVKELVDNFSYSRIGVLMDENTKRDCLPLLYGSIEKFTSIEIGSGEKNKSLSSCEFIWSVLTKEEFDRKSLIINLGGGVICDLGGFAASTFKRGLDFINIPTTLLAQVDASIGGKNGIDFMGFKNHIGVFKDPINVIIDSEFLETLPAKEIRSGFAEIIKHCLIGDAEFFKAIQNSSLENQNWDNHIIKSLELKHRIVSQDPFEKETV